MNNQQPERTNPATHTHIVGVEHDASNVTHKARTSQNAAGILVYWRAMKSGVCVIGLLLTAGVVAGADMRAFTFEKSGKTIEGEVVDVN
jgi:hypothetical protein